MITRDNGPICCSSLAVRCSLFTQPFDLFAIDHRTNKSTQCYSMVHTHTAMNSEPIFTCTAMHSDNVRTTHVGIVGIHWYLLG